MTTGLGESRMRWKAHVRFGSGPGKRAAGNAGTAPRLDSTNRMLNLPGASVTDVGFGPSGVVVAVRLRRRRRVCAVCGSVEGLEVHEHRVKRWRHLDLGGCRCTIECELRRLRCRTCGVHLEPVPWARPVAGYTRDFEDVVAWLAQQMAKTPIARLLHVA